MKRDVIFVVPHYVNSLRYFDKLYESLISKRIELVYIIRNDKKMIDFCIENERLYEILELSSQYNVKLFFEPFVRHLFKKKIENFINKYKPKLILQPNDTNVYNDLIVKIAKKKKN